MNLDTKISNTFDYCDRVNVALAPNNRVVLGFNQPHDLPVIRYFDPSQAVLLWRCLVGEIEHADIKANDILSVSYTDDDKRWTINLGNNLIASLDADQAMALAWGIKNCVVNSLDITKDVANKDKVIAISLREVWVITSHVILTGDSTADGSESIGGSSMVFSSAEKARDSLREFMRPLVNEAYSEGRWIESDRSVDDVIDEIIEKEQNSGGESTWILDGLNQSFRITLSKKIVDAV